LELRTTFNIEPSADKITYSVPVMFVGSCFATSIGRKLEKGRMPVMINPTGAVYNPVSVSHLIGSIVGGHDFTEDDLYFHDGSWISFNHYTDFCNEDPVLLLEKMNKRTTEALDFIGRAGFLFITFGTARIFRFKETGKIVSNCHKVPPAMFQRELLTINTIVELWTDQLNRLHSLFPQLKIVFTVSPVRHLKDGAHGNQISKAVLLLAIEELLNHPSKPHYFPAYELLMDDLRDYRFYGEDMLHPSAAAIDYIWEAFASCYIESKTLDLIQEVTNITNACDHRFNTSSLSKRAGFAETMIRKITMTSNKLPSVDFKGELEYFRSLL
jgi:hypothetical protein